MEMDISPDTIGEPEVFDNRLDRIQQYLSSNDANIFARLLERRPDINTLLRYLTYIIAPNDSAIESFLNGIGMNLATAQDDPRFRDIMSNHLSVLLMPFYYPSYTAINQFIYGKAPDDIFQAAGVYATGTIDGIQIGIGHRILYTEIQLGRFQVKQLSDLDAETIVDLIQRGNIRGRDLISLCSTSYALQTICDAKHQWIYRKFLKEEFEFDYTSDLRDTPAQLYKLFHQDWQLLEYILNRLSDIDDFLAGNADYRDANPEYRGTVDKRLDVFDLLYNPQNWVMLTDQILVRGGFDYNDRYFDDYGVNHIVMGMIWHLVTEIRLLYQDISHLTIFEDILLGRNVKLLETMPELRGFRIEALDRYVNFPKAFTEWRFSTGSPDIIEQIKETGSMVVRFTEGCVDEEGKPGCEWFPNEELNLLNRIHQAVRSGRITCLERLKPALVGKLRR